MTTATPNDPTNYPLLCLFLVCGLPVCSNVENSLMASLLHQTSASVKVQIVGSNYGTIQFSNPDAANDFVSKTHGTLWVGGVQCHLVSCLDDFAPLCISQGTYAQDFFNSTCLVDLQRAVFYDSRSDMYYSALTHRNYCMDPETGELVEMIRAASTNHSSSSLSLASGSDAIMTNSVVATTTTTVGEAEHEEIPLTLQVFVAPFQRAKPIWNKTSNLTDNDSKNSNGYYVSKKDGKPACGLCRLKFACLEDLQRHELSSLTHLEKTAPWVDRAKIRRLTAQDSEKIVTTKDALETPLDLRDSNNKGAMMMKKMGWIHGQSLGV